MPANVKEKKSKAKQFNHARDNAISALGKIIRHQGTNVDAAALVPNWLSLLPIKNDVDEAKIMNELLVNLIQENPMLVFGDQYQRFELVVLIIAEISNKKYINDETGVKIARILQGIAADATLGPHFQTIVTNKLTKDSQDRIQNALNFQ